MKSLALFVSASVLIVLSLVSTPAAVVRAQGPVGGALQTLSAATVYAGQTRDAAAAELANQRLTATALDNQQRAVSIQQTQTAAAQTATAYAQSATATAEARATQAAQANATATVQANATATAQAAQSATAQAQQTATVQAAQSATAQVQQTEAAKTTSAQATATRVAVIAATDERNSQIVSIVVAVGALIGIVAQAIALVRAAWQIKRPVLIVAETAPAEASVAESVDLEIPTTALSAVRIVQTDDDVSAALSQLFKEGTD